MKRSVKRDEKLLKKMEYHLHQLSVIDEYQERYIPYNYHFMDFKYYYILRISIFIVIRTFREYGIDLEVPILRQADEEEMENCDCWVYEDMFDFSFRLFCQFGWHIEEVSCDREFKVTDIEACIGELPDGRNEYFLRFQNILEIFNKNCNTLDYFAILYFPGLGNLEIWLKAHRRGNERLLRLYERCTKQIKYVFCEGYSEYPGANINGTWYVPIIMGYNESDSADDVSMANFMMGRLFDAFVLSVLYNTAKERGYDD